MAYLVKPERSELAYRKKLYDRQLTTSHQPASSLFPKEEWDRFYQAYVEADPKQAVYRYIFCPACNDFTGEVSWLYHPEKNRYEMQIMIASEMRREGYGRKGVRLLQQLASENKIGPLYAVVEKDNPAVGFFDHLGFHHEEEDHFYLYHIQ